MTVAQKMFLTMTLVATSVCPSNAQTFFWSTADIGEGVVQSDLVLDPGGDSRTAYLYYAPEGHDIIAGFDIDFSWSNSSAQFTAAETFDFDITIVDIAIGPRWGDYSGAVESLTPNSIEGFLVVNTVSGTGILEANNGSPFLDLGYDSESGAFQVGSIDWDFDGSGPSQLVVDNAIVVGRAQAINATFLNLSISPIPEPNSAIALSACLFGLLNRRKSP